MGRWRCIASNAVLSVTTFLRNRDENSSPQTGDHGYVRFASMAGRRHSIGTKP